VGFAVSVPLERLRCSPPAADHGDHPDPPDDLGTGEDQTLEGSSTKKRVARSYSPTPLEPADRRTVFARTLGKLVSPTEDEAPPVTIEERGIGGELRDEHRRTLEPALPQRRQGFVRLLEGELGGAGSHAGLLGDREELLTILPGQVGHGPNDAFAP